MDKPPEEIRSEIDDVREDLGDTLEAIGDRVAPKKVMARAKADAADKVGEVKARLSPRRLAQRGADAARKGLRGAVGSDDASPGRGLPAPAVAPPVPGRLMAQRSAQTATVVPRRQAKALAKRTSEAVGSVTDTLGDAPQELRRKAEGNPAAAGLLAFAGGFFAAALLPATDRERQLTEKAKQRLAPLGKEAAEVGKSVAGELQSSAQASLEAVKGTATEAVEEVKGRAQSSAVRVKDEASDATEEVTAQTKGATTTVKKQAKAAKGAVKGEAKKAAASTKKAPAPRRSPRPAARPPVVATPRGRP